MSNLDFEFSQTWVCSKNLQSPQHVGKMPKIPHFWRQPRLAVYFLPASIKASNDFTGGQRNSDDRDSLREKMNHIVFIQLYCS